MAGGIRPGALIPAAAFVSLLQFDVLRVWLPSLLFVVADAGETSALVMGAIAIAIAAIPPIVVVLTPRRRVRGLWVTGVAILLAARLLLQLGDGGLLQFSAAATALGASAVAIGALGAGTDSAGLARFGVLLGFAASGVIHAGLAMTDLVWRSGTVGWVATLGLVAAAAGATWPARHLLDGDGDGRGRAWPWWLLGPVLLLITVLLLVPGRVATATRWADELVAATVVAFAGLLILAVLLGRWVGPAVAGPAGAGLVLVGVAGSLEAGSLIAVLAQAVLAVGLGAIVAALDRTGGDGSPRLVGAAAAGSPLLLVILGFVYYAGYDLPLPFSNRLVLLLTAVLVAGAALLAGATRERIVLRERGFATRLVRVTAVTAATALVAALLVSGSDRGPPEVGATDEAIRVAVANIHMGFDPEGRLSVHELSQVLDAHSPDLVVLNEVDRGWLTTGSRDTLRQLSGQLGLPYVFGPAADEVWGNAILSRYPIREFSVERLPRGRDAMARSQLIALVEVAPDRQVAVIATHLSHVDVQGDTRVPQARAIAATVARLQERDIPIILAGDLNAEPDDPELAIFEDVLRSVLPPGNPTFPSSDPEVQIDHLLVDDAFDFRDGEVLETEVSDHRPLTGILELRGTP